MSVLTTPGPSRRKILTPYVMLWLAIASFALAYLALLGLKPHMFASAKNSAAEIDEKIAQTRRDMERGLADLDPLRRSVGEVKMDVENLKVAVEEANVRDRVIMEKVAALENAAASAPPATAAPAQAPAAASATVPPAPKPKPKPVASNASGAASGGIETGSIERKSVPPAAKPAKAAAKSAPVGVIVATGPTIDALRLNWSILTDRYADAVRNMQPRYVVNGNASNRVYGLVVGPVASTAAAKSLCQNLQSRGMACQVGTYRGNTL